MEFAFLSSFYASDEKRRRRFCGAMAVFASSFHDIV